MSKYILVYDINDYHEMGGGTHVEIFADGDKERMDKRVNELAKIHKEQLKIFCAGYMTTIYEYRPVQQVVEYQSIVMKNDGIPLSQ